MTSQTATETLVAPARRRPRAGALTLGVSTVYLSIIVLIPIAAIFAKGFEDGWSAFWTEVTRPEAVATLKLTFAISLVVVAINAVAQLIKLAAQRRFG